MSTDTSYAGMSGFSMNTTFTTKDTDNGNSNGNVVDNSAGNNPVNGAPSTETEVKPTQTQGSAGGAYLKMYAGAPSWIANNL